MRRRLQHDPTWERTVRVIWAALRWLEATSTTREGLAAILHVDRADLTRFLQIAWSHEGDRDDPANYYHLHERCVPRPSRPAKMRLLEDLERVVGSDHLIEMPETEVVPIGPGSEDREWFVRHRARCAQLQNLDAAAVLNLSGEFIAQAIHGPAQYRATMVINVLLTLACALEEKAKNEQSGRPIGDSLAVVEGRLGRLVEAGTEAARGLRDAHADGTLEPRVKGYAGYCYFLVGLRSGSRDLSLRGVDCLVEALQLEHDPRDRLWPQSLVYVELAAKLADAELFESCIKAFGDLADAQRSPDLKAAMIEKHIPHVLEAWKSSFPGLVEWARGE